MTTNTHPTSTPDPVDPMGPETMIPSHPTSCFDEKAEDEANKQMMEGDRIMVNLEAIEVVPNLDEVSCENMHRKDLV